MSGFPPPKFPNQHLDELFVSPFSLDDNPDEAKTQSGVQTSESGSGGQSERSASGESPPATPRLTSRPSQSSLHTERADPSLVSDDGYAYSHTPPVVTPRGMSGTTSPSLPPTDFPPPLPQITAGLRRLQSTPGDSNASIVTTATPGSASSLSTRTITTTSSTGHVGVGAAQVKKTATSSSYRLPETENIKGKRIISHALLAKQLIHAESQGYKKPLKDGSVAAILRGKVWLKVETNDKGETIPQPDEQNAISQFSEPFMEHYFDTSEVKARLDQVTENFNKQQAEAAALYDQLGASDFSKGSAGAALMRPIIAPIADYILESDNSIRTSNMPAPVLAAMLALDDEVQAWYKKNGGNDPAELDSARKNALKGVFGVRSFIPGYVTGLYGFKKDQKGEMVQQEKTVEQGFYQPLTSFLISYLNKEYGLFLDSVLGCPKEQRELIKRQATIIESRPILPLSERSKIDETKERFQKREPSNILARLKDKLGSVTSTGEKNTLTSPRRGLQRSGTINKEMQSASDDGPKSPRSVGSNNKNLGVESNEARDIKKARDRQAILNQYLKGLKLNSIKDFSELGEILRGFKEKIVNASSDDFRKFRDNPNSFFHGFLKDVIAQIQVRGGVASAALQRYYIELSDSLGIDDE